MKKKRIFVLCLVILLILATAGAALAGSSTRFDVYWQVISGGGAPASSGDVGLNGSLGQSLIGASSSTSYGLDAGYWRQGSFMIYLPVLLKQ